MSTPEDLGELPLPGPAEDGLRVRAKALPGGPGAGVALTITLGRVGVGSALLTAEEADQLAGELMLAAAVLKDA